MASRKLKIEAEVGANVTPLERAFKRAQGAGASFARNLGLQIAGAFSLGALVTFGKRMSETAATIKDMAAQMQVTTDEAQRLAFEAELTGITWTDLRANLNRLGTARQKAIEGDERQLQLLRALGVSFDRLNNSGLRNVDILTTIGKAMDKMDANKVEAFKQIFGVEAFKTIEALRGLGQDKDVPIISPEALDNIDSATKKMEMLGQAAEKWAAEMLGGNEATKAIGGVVDALTGHIGFAMEQLMRGPLEAFGIIRKSLQSLGFLSGADRPADLFENIKRKQTAKAEIESASVFDARKKLEDAEQRAALARMTEGERYLAIEQQIADIRERAAGIGNETARLKMLREAVNLEIKLAGMKTPAQLRDGTAEEMAQMTETMRQRFETAQEKLRVSGLSADERIGELEREIGLRKRAAGQEGLLPAARFDLLREAAEMQMEQNRLRELAGAPAGGGIQAADALARIGGVLGPGSNQQQRINQQQLSELKKVNSHFERGVKLKDGI